MGRPLRGDDVDAWFHVMNRGAGRMPMFDRAGDADRFFERLAKVVEDEEVEVHAYVVMGNHFHLLVRSPRRELARALQRIQGPYAQYFNRTRERDGPIHRARYKAIHVRSYEYRCLLVAYIDWNPVCAGLAKTPEQYAHGSAFHYGRRLGPKWLTRAWVEEEVCRRAQISRYGPTAYASTLGRSPTPGQERLLERRRGGSEADIDDVLDTLLTAAPIDVERWLLSRHRVTGSWAPRPIVDEESVLDVGAAMSDRECPVPGAGPTEAREVALVGLLRELCGSTIGEIVARTGIGEGSVRRRSAAHRHLLARQSAYSAELARLAVRAIARCHAR